MVYRSKRSALELILASGILCHDNRPLGFGVDYAGSYVWSACASVVVLKLKMQTWDSTKTYSISSRSMQLFRVL